MKLSIINGIWNLQTLDGAVQLTVLPRRSPTSAATQVSLRAEPMPALVIDPESILVDVPMEAWVWDGSSEAARRIIPHVIAAIRTKLESRVASSPKVLAWREAVLASIFPVNDQEAVHFNQA